MTDNDKQDNSVRNGTKPDQYRVVSNAKGDYPSEPRAATYSIEIEFFNYTGYRVCVGETNGMLTVHEPSKTSTTVSDYIGCFVIKIVRRLRIDCSAVAMHESVNATGSTEDCISRTVHELNHCKDNLNSKNPVSDVILIKYKDIESSKKPIFVPNIGMSILIDRHRASYVHPLSSKAMEQEVNKIFDGAHTLTIEINSSKPEHTYYTNILGRVVTIYTVACDQVGEYFRIMYKMPNKPAEVLATGVYTEEALKEIGIFRNYQEADNMRDKTEFEKMEKEQRLNDSKMELESKKVETNLFKAESENQTMLNKLELMQKQHEAEIKKMMMDAEKRDKDHVETVRNMRFEQEKADLVMRQIRDKDYYESRSLDRKDSSEALKFLPIFLGGALALFSMVNK